MTPFTSFDEACDYLFKLERVDRTGLESVELKLDKMVKLLDGLGNPQNDYRTVHVAGTNGKGSTCSFLSAILSLSGYRTGLHTSPHLFSFTERMKVNGRAADRSWIVSACNKMHRLIKQLKPSFFEASTAIAFLYFSEMEVDIAVIEVGLGGRLDATNVIVPELALITQIDFDHVGKLGNTKEEIAAEKAGIIKPSRPIILGDRDPKVQSVIREIAKKQNSSYLDLEDLVAVAEPGNSPSFRMVSSNEKWQNLKIGLNGLHQNYNAAMAIGAATLIHGQVKECIAREALKDVVRISGIRGRCEIMSDEPFVVADVAHNPQGFSSGISWFMSNAPQEGRKQIVFGVSEDKDYKSMLKCLQGLDITVIPVKSKVKRGLETSIIIEMLDDLGIKHLDLGKNVSETVDYLLKHSSRRDSLYLGGSHYTVGEVPSLFFESN